MGHPCPISNFNRHQCLLIAGVLRKSLRTIAIELQVHLTLSVLQAAAYIMSDSGFGSFVWIRSKTVIRDEEAVIHIA